MIICSGASTYMHNTAHVGHVGCLGKYLGRYLVTSGMMADNQLRDKEWFHGKVKI